MIRTADANSIKTSRADMNGFLDHLYNIRKNAQATDAFKRTRGYRLSAIEKKITEGAHEAAKRVFMSIYTNAVPVDNNHKIVYESSIQKTMQKLIEESGEANVYSYLNKAATDGSIPAKLICENAKKYVSDACMKYFAEDSVDIDKVDIEPEISDAVVKITSDMDAAAVSQAIENSVRTTIAKEMEISKQEDERLAELEKRLASDDRITEEGHIEGMLIGEGYIGSKNIYTPNLFTGIMIGKVKAFTEEGGLDSADVQKKAYYESVKELTALQTLHTLGCITIDAKNVDKYTRRYMAG